jgi:hypothetical protein
MKMTKIPVLTVAGIFVVCLSLAFPAFAQEKGYDTLLGEWDVETEGGQYAFVFIFTMEGDTLKGLFKGSTGDYQMKDLSYENNQVQFAVTIDAGGQTMSLDFFATIDQDRLEGYLSMDYGEANITGKKRK